MGEPSSGFLHLTFATPKSLNRLAQANPSKVLSFANCSQTRLDETVILSAYGKRFALKLRIFWGHPENVGLGWGEGGKLRMETGLAFLWPVIVLGGLGAFIDFLLGRAGQEQVKDFLLKWWMSFDDVNWRNFGRSDALFVTDILQRWFGKSVWSLRRLYMVFITYFVLWMIAFSIHYSAGVYDYSTHGFDIILQLFVPMLGCLSMSLAISLTCRIMLLTARLSSRGTLWNALVWIVSVIINYVIFVIWTNGMESIKYNAEGAIGDIIFDPMTFITAPLNGLISAGKTIWEGAPRDLSHLLTPLIPFSITGEIGTLQRDPQDVGNNNSFQSIGNAVVDTMSVIGFLLRMGISIIFVGSFLMKPLIAKPVSLVWARIIESDKPVFTLVFSGASAIATAVREVVKHL
jgi:hypothetical protein